jgi:hypothetical protein
MSLAGIVVSPNEDVPGLFEARPGPVPAHERDCEAGPGLAMAVTASTGLARVEGETRKGHGQAGLGLVEARPGLVAAGPGLVATGSGLDATLRNLGEAGAGLGRSLRGHGEDHDGSVLASAGELAPVR